MTPSGAVNGSFLATTAYQIHSWQTSIPTGSCNRGNSPSSSLRIWLGKQPYLSQFQTEDSSLAAKIFHIESNSLAETTWQSERFVRSDQQVELIDLKPLVKQALETPIGYPSFDQSLTPEDRVAIAVSKGVPQVDQIIVEVVGYLIDNGISAERITVVFPSSREAEEIGSSFQDKIPESVKIESHDPTDDEQLCFAGMMKHDRPLMLNRSLYDADVLLPILMEQPANYLHAGPYDGLFPEFCGQKTQERITRVRSIAGARTRGGDHLAERRREAREAGWVIGVPLLMRVIPSIEGGAPQILAGEPLELEQAAKNKSEPRLAIDVDQLADLVIVSLGTDDKQHTWQSASRALQVADEMVTSDGAIVLWTQINESVGKSLSKLLGNDDFDRIAHDLSEDSGDEAWAAWQILQARERGSVFFHSQINDEVVEELGLAPLHNLEELHRLVERRETTIIVDEAQHRFIRSSVKQDIDLWEDEIE